MEFRMLVMVVTILMMMLVVGSMMDFDENGANNDVKNNATDDTRG